MTGGHPYEPLLAVSGIDSTIKIFSPDQRAQEDARKGINVTRHDRSGWSSLEFGGMARRRRRRAEPANESVGLRSMKRMDQEYQITSQNDVERRGGMRDAYITVGQRVAIDFAEWL